MDPFIQKHMDKDFTDNFLAKGKIKLKDFDTEYKGKLEKEEGQQMLADEKKRLHELQERLYADGSKSLLIVLQAMDAAGKDEAISYIFSNLSRILRPGSSSKGTGIISGL